MRRDYVSVAILWFVLSFLGELLLPGMLNRFVPLVAAEEGLVVDSAFRQLSIMGIPVFAFVVAVLIYSVVRFRSQGDPTEDGPPIRSNGTVYTAWLLATALLAVTVLIHPGITGLAELHANPSADLVVQVTAEQWNWTFTYPQYGVTVKKAKELVLPVDTRTKFEVTSRDVLHSFWIPAFRMKIDAVPGQITTMYITPNAIGTFDDDPSIRVQCAELCGTGHARMRAHLTVLSADEFQNWIAAQAELEIAQTQGGQ